MAKETELRITKIETPEGFLLNGLWAGPKRAKTAYIFLHGLGGSIFSSTAEIALSLADEKNAVLLFNNRGSGIITGFKKKNLKKKSGYDSRVIGKAHEVFTDCADDIEGAVRFALQRGAKKIILLGHSTGCQKSVYYLSQKPHSSVRGAVLLAPISDYASARKTIGTKNLKSATSLALRLVKNNKPSELLPRRIAKEPIDAQRFLSLFTPDSKEEIFSYATKKLNPIILKNTRLPLLIMLAHSDEYRDRPTERIANWFKIHKPADETVIIKKARHNFAGKRDLLKKIIRKWSERL